MVIRIPENVRRIIEKLEEYGHEAYAVGGCVRDALLHRIPQDWDITTSASPEQVKALFRRTIDTGIQHGTVTIMLGNDGYEVTTYRIDGEYEDARHPKQVVYTTDLAEDLRRRDFTINAMAYNPKTGLVDLFGGAEDLKNKIVRCVGSPHERFTEDALRILRAIRFSAQLGFEIEAGTDAAIKELAPTLTKISRERVQAEVTKLLVSDHPQYFRKVYEAGITKQFFPEFDVMMEMEGNSVSYDYNIGEHSLAMLGLVGGTPVLRWTTLLHDCGKPFCPRVETEGAVHYVGHAEESAVRAKRILKELKFDNDTIDHVTKLITWHTEKFTDGKPAIRRCLNHIGPDLFRLFLELATADVMTKRFAIQDDDLFHYMEVKRLFLSILADGDCYRMDQLAVNGADLKAAGVNPGPAMGHILKAMLEDVMIVPERNTKDYLLGHLAEYQKIG